MRGERAAKAEVEASGFGPSPRARRTPGRSVGATVGPRFIPACAGNAGKTTPKSCRRSVHPRVRGERSDPKQFDRVRSGSSPRARGTPQSRGLALFWARFIPACAGNAYPESSSPLCLTVHPRVRGERRFSPRPAARFDGSSPRARGTLAHFIRSEILARFIPACAGNANYKSSRACLGTVHPRVRGERKWRTEAREDYDGSSPRARGTRFPGHTQRAPSRFIPACAGNARAQSGSGDRAPVHPRVRGERAQVVDQIIQLVGSSPRARGTRALTLCVMNAKRFIPACAGNARSARAWCRRRAVHPRVRGERLDPLDRAVEIAGSSPRARGTRPTGVANDGADRFIPACAGNAFDG